MIGGRVLDTSAVVAFARQTSVYMAAVVWTATEEDIVLLVPTSVLASARAELDDPARAVLDVLLSLPVTVVDALDRSRATAVGEVTGVDGVPTAHVVTCASERGWAIVTAEPDRYRAVGTIEIEELP